MTKEEIVYSAITLDGKTDIKLTQDDLNRIEEHMERQKAEREDEIKLNKSLLEAFHLFKWLSRVGQDDKQKFLKYISKLLDRTEKRTKLLEELNKEPY